jgi:hypothetical protein
MAWLKKKPDPISDRARALNDEIAHLEAEIKRLDSQLQRNSSHPRLRSTAVPHGATVNHSGRPPAPTGAAAPVTPPPAQEPIFEEVAQNPLQARPGSTTTPEHYNELGVRKYDLPALWQRIRNHFRGPSTTNPKLVSYLAAGGVQGLRPLRYEKRVARNRFIALAIFLLLLLLGLFSQIARIRR